MSNPLLKGRRRCDSDRRPPLHRHPRRHQLERVPRRQGAGVVAPRARLRTPDHVPRWQMHYPQGRPRVGDDQGHAAGESCSRRVARDRGT